MSEELGAESKLNAVQASHAWLLRARQIGRVRPLCTAVSLLTSIFVLNFISDDHAQEALELLFL